MRTHLLAAALLLFASAASFAQSGAALTLNTTAWDGARTPDGQPDVHGSPYQAWAIEQKKKNYANRATEDTDAKCYLPGVPRITYMPYPFRIIQTPKRIDMSYEYVGALRHIFTNGTPHPPGHIDWWMGDSRGRWEGDTLVVDVIHFNDQTRFDKAGNFHSDALHVVERYSVIDASHLNYEMTIEDPKVFTRPWKMQMPLYKRIEPSPRVLEYYSRARVLLLRLQRRVHAARRPLVPDQNRGGIGASLRNRARSASLGMQFTTRGSLMDDAL
jgi:hypothetical protein